MNLKKSHYNMTWLPFFIDVIDNKCKCIKAYLEHPQIKCDYTCGGFNKCKKNMAFYGLTNHVKDTFTSELLLVRKDNPTTLMMHKPSQPNIFSGVQRMAM